MNWHIKNIILCILLSGVAPSNAMMRQIANRASRMTAAALLRMPKTQLATAAKQTAKNFTPLRNPQRALKIATGLVLAGQSMLTACDSPSKAKVALPFEIRYAINPHGGSFLEKLWYGDMSRLSKTMILEKWYKNNPSQELRDAVSSYAARHFTESSPDVLQTILRHDADAAKNLLPVALEHFRTTQKTHYAVLSDLITRNQQAIEEFTEATLAHIDIVCYQVLSQTLSATTAKRFTAAALAKASHVSWPKFRLIMRSDPELTIDDIIKAIDPEFFELIHSDQLSQSLNHIRHNLDSVKEDILMWKEHIGTFKKILKKELDLKEGFAFYHGQRLSHFFPEYLDTQLLGIQKDIPVDDFLLLHTKANPIDEATRMTQPNSPEYFQKESEAREKEEHYHACLFSYSSEGRLSKLFVNGGLFINSAIHSSNSVHFFAENRNIGSYDSETHNKTADIFRHRHLEKYAAEFTPKFEKLREKFEKASKYGVIHMIVIPENNIDNMVMPVVSGGILRVLKVQGEYTSDMKIIGPALRTKEYICANDHCSNKDTFEFAIPQTNAIHGALNVQSGIKVYSFVAEQDDEAVTQIKKEILATVAQLKKRVEADRPSGTAK